MTFRPRSVASSRTSTSCSAGCPLEELTVLTTALPRCCGFRPPAGFRVERSRSPVLLPTPGLARTVRQLSQATGGGLVLLDPALPLGLLGSWLPVPYGVVLHGAEVAVPGRLPVSRQLLRSVLSGASLAIAAGGYPAAEAARVAGRASPGSSSCLPGSTTSASIRSALMSAWRCGDGWVCPPRAGLS